MFAVMGSLLLLLIVAIYSALVVGKKTDQRIAKYLSDEDEDSTILVRFPEDVFRPKETSTGGEAGRGIASAQSGKGMRTIGPGEYKV